MAWNIHSTSPARWKFPCHTEARVYSLFKVKRFYCLRGLFGDVKADTERFENQSVELLKACFVKVHAAFSDAAKSLMCNIKEAKGTGNFKDIISDCEHAALSGRRRTDHTWHQIYIRANQAATAKIRVKLPEGEPPLMVCRCWLLKISHQGNLHCFTKPHSLLKYRKYSCFLNSTNRFILLSALQLCPLN